MSNAHHIDNRVAAVRALLTCGCAIAAAALAGCSHRPSTRADAWMSAAGCYAGTGLHSATPDTGAATVVLDSVAEPGARRFHARLATGSTARAGFWGPGTADTVGIAVVGMYPPAVYTLRHEGDSLVGTAQLFTEMPGVSVDTVPWPVSLTRTSCAAALAALETSGTPEVQVPAAVRAELAHLDTTDQALRAGATAATFADTAFLHRLTHEDSARTNRLEAIIAQYGWPAPSRVGEVAAAGAFLILQHSPSKEFQRRMLPTLDTMARVGEAAGQDLALLTDRVLKGEGQPQRYGSQFDVKGGRFVLWPIADSATVDARRAALGLMPLADYEQALAAMYHASVKH